MKLTFASKEFCLFSLCATVVIAATRAHVGLFILLLTNMICHMYSVKVCLSYLMFAKMQNDNMTNQSKYILMNSFRTFYFLLSFPLSGICLINRENICFTVLLIRNWIVPGKVSQLRKQLLSKKIILSQCLLELQTIFFLLLLWLS